MTQLSSEKPELFKGLHFNHLLIIQAVRWYVTYKLSYRDVCDLMAQRGVTVVHTTVLRWVQRFVPVSLLKTRSGLKWAVNNVRLTVNVRLHFQRSKYSAHDCKLMKMLGDEVFAMDKPRYRLHHGGPGSAGASVPARIRRPDR